MGNLLMRFLLLNLVCKSRMFVHSLVGSLVGVWTNRNTANILSAQLERDGNWTNGDWDFPRRFIIRLFVWIYRGRVTEPWNRARTNLVHGIQPHGDGKIRDLYVVGWRECNVRFAIEAANDSLKQSERKYYTIHPTNNIEEKN